MISKRFLLSLLPLALAARFAPGAQAAAPASGGHRQNLPPAARDAARSGRPAPCPVWGVPLRLVELVADDRDAGVFYFASGNWLQVHAVRDGLAKLTVTAVVADVDDLVQSELRPGECAVTFNNLLIVKFGQRPWGGVTVDGIARIPGA
jgi:hypothetical protein